MASNYVEIPKLYEASAGVDTFNARAGAVVPVAGDYTASDITNVPAGDVASSNVQDAIDEIANFAVKTLFVQTASKTVANSAAETTLISTGVGSATLSADFLVPGRTIRLQARGYHSSTGNPNITLKFKIDGVTISTGTVASGNGSTDGFVIDCVSTCRTDGVTGTIIGQGYYNEEHSNGAKIGLIATAVSTIDTTASNAVDLTIQWGTASNNNTITVTNLTIEALGV